MTNLNPMRRQKITRSLRISGETDELVQNHANELGCDNISQGYQYFIDLGLKIYRYKVKLESDPDLEPQVREEFQETISKITNEKIMFEEVSKMPERKVRAIKEMMTMDLERRFDKD